MFAIGGWGDAPSSNVRGYFEWIGVIGDKTPHFLHAADDSLLAAAGLSWSMEVKAQRTRCFLVVTVRRATPVATSTTACRCSSPTGRWTPGSTR